MASIACRCFLIWTVYHSTSIGHSLTSVMTEPAHQEGDATWQFYESHADVYAARTLQLSVEVLWTEVASRLKRGACILDVGCGAGRDLKELARRGLEPVGLDYSPALAAKAETHSGRPVRVGDVG